MNINEFRERIESLITHVLFDYKNKHCGVDPMSATHYEMWCGEQFMIAKSIDEVFDAPFFDKKALKDIFPQITNID